MSGLLNVTITVIESLRLTFTCQALSSPETAARTCSLCQLGLRHRRRGGGVARSVHHSDPARRQTWGTAWQMLSSRRPISSSTAAWLRRAWRRSRAAPVGPLPSASASSRALGTCASQSLSRLAFPVHCGCNCMRDTMGLCQSLLPICRCLLLYPEGLQRVGQSAMGVRQTSTVALVDHRSQDC